MNLFHNQSISNENKSLGKIARVFYSEFTTTYEGNRNPYTSGIFLPEFHQSHNGTAILTGVIHSLKLVTRATPRNKTGSRANKWGFSYEAVEPLLHLFRTSFKSVQQALLTKPYEGISMLYTFLYIQSRLRITVLAESLSQAETRRPLGKAIFIARRPNSNGGAVC